ncbi:hypothetical protein [Parapedobacter sp. 10938]|uniref:hypothetical protein n=1 Tax=Parapedobacter flavus TaxID=3110225 RepID=UPI002DBF25D4|nr:hypothetical protein [Parapedobacter sp. 10938]MEC3880378.1 hypothetical protein [Parapedobacter sp. 10938]
MLRPLLSMILSMLCFIALAQRAQKLLVVENKKGDISYQYLTTYTFKDGLFTSKDTIFEDKPGPPDISFHLGSSSWHENRYVIGSDGAVIDVKYRKLIWENSDPKDRFIEALGDTLVYERRKDGQPTEFYFLDLATLTYHRAKAGSFRKTNKSASNHRALFYSPNGRKTIYTAYLKRVEIRDENFKLLDAIPDPDLSGPIIMNLELSRIGAHWLDNDNFLYDNHIFHKDAKMHTVELRQYTLSTKHDTTLFRIDSVNVTQLPQGKFSKDHFNHIHYRATNGRRYLLNLESGTILPDPYFFLNAQFSYTGYNASAALRDKYKGLTYRYGEREIGTVWGNDATATDNALAVAYADVGANLGYPKGIKVWTAPYNGWTTFDLPWLYAIIGWME